MYSKCICVHQVEMKAIHSRKPCFVLFVTIVHSLTVNKCKEKWSKFQHLIYEQVVGDGI